MIKDVITVSKYDSLEDAVYIMMKNKVGVLPVVDNNQVYGIITDKDVFKAFLEVSGYGEEGVRISVLTADNIGSLSKVVDTITNEGLNIKSAVTAPRKNNKVIIEIQVDGKIDANKLEEKLVKLGFEVESISQTHAKSF